MRKLAALALSAFFLLSPIPLLAAFSVEDSGLGATADAAKYRTDGDNSNIAEFIGFYIIQPVLGILGLIFFCLMIYAGFLWMTAAGDDKKVARAKDIIRAAIIGAVVVVSAYAITNAVFQGLETGSVTST